MADNKNTILCPACGKEMQKIYMPEAKVNIDICLDGCGGIFFDNRELEKFDETHESVNEILEAVKGREFKEVDSEETRICPICKIPMVKMGSGKGGVEIDVCNTCGAKFLDNLELQLIRLGQKVDLSQVDGMMNALFAENLKEVLGDNADNPASPSPRRQFFENLFHNYLIR